MVKNEWTMPVGIVEQFMPSEYISVCYVTKCTNAFTGSYYIFQENLSNGPGDGQAHDHDFSGVSLSGCDENCSSVADTYLGTAYFADCNEEHIISASDVGRVDQFLYAFDDNVTDNMQAIKFLCYAIPGDKRGINHANMNAWSLADLKQTNAS